MGQTAKGHKPEHPMQEYCTSTGASVNLRNLGQAFRNSFRTKKYFRKKQQKLGYLPVNKSGQQEPEELHDDAKDSSAPASLPPPSLSPNLSAADSLAAGSHNGSLVPKTVQQPDESSPAKAQLQQRQHQPPPPPSIKGPSNKTTELHDTDDQDHDEHSLIARLCGRLKEASALEELSDTDTDSAGGGNSLPRGGGGRRGELEKMIFRLEDENRRLTDEYEALRAKRIRQDSERGEGGGEEEARRLRQKSARMEARMKILEDHNRRLLEQLDRLRQLHATQQQQDAGLEEEGASSPPLRLMSPEHLPAGMRSSLAPGAPGQDEGTNQFGTLQSKSVVATMLSAEQPGGMNNGGSSLFSSYRADFPMNSFLAQEMIP